MTIEKTIYKRKEVINMEYFMVDVPACNMQAIEKIIARLVKKGIKARLDVTREAVKNVPVKRITDDRKVEDTGIKEPVSVVDFDLTVENASLGDWELLGTKERLGDGAIYRGNIPDEYKNANFDCHHCNTHRRHNKVAIIRHIDNGETKQVGYTCLQDFIGMELGAFGALIKGLDEIVANENYYGGSSYNSGKCWYYHVGQYLQIAYNCIVNYGYVKPNNDYYNVAITTLERISIAYSNITNEYVAREKVDTDLIDKIKQAFYDFAESHPSDFTHNVCTVLQQTCVDCKYTKLLYFVPTFYLNKVKWEAKKQKAEAKKQAFMATLNNEWAGNVGDKITTEATLTGNSSFDGQYGVMYVYNFTDVQGRMLVWFTSKALYVDEGDTITIKGTVKKLSEYKGFKQTVLTRCKVKVL